MEAAIPQSKIHTCSKFVKKPLQKCFKYFCSDQSEAGLKLLTSQQALADYIQFIRWFKTQQRIPTAKVVVFGGSYGGNLAAWIRELYPNDINVAVSSSGPLNATFDMFRESIRTKTS